MDGAMDRKDVPRTKVQSVPGVGSNKGYTAALREVAVDAYADIGAKASVAGALAHSLWGAGNYAVRKRERGVRVYRLA